MSDDDNSKVVQFPMRKPDDFVFIKRKSKEQIECEREAARAFARVAAAMLEAHEEVNSTKASGTMVFGDLTNGFMFQFRIQMGSGDDYDD